MWKKYKVTLYFINRLCGSTPLDTEMIKGWLDARKPSARPPQSRTIDEITEEAIASVAVQDMDKENEELANRTTLGFQMHEGKLVMRGGTLKAHMKDCARIISSFTGRIEGERSFAVKVVNCAYIADYWIPILKNGKAVKEPDGFFDKSVHMQTPRGPRNALKRIGFIEKPQIVFGLNIMETPKGEVVRKEDLKKLFDYGGVHGYAGERGDGEGRYIYEIKEV